MRENNILTFIRPPKACDHKAEVILDFNEGEYKRFYVRFYDTELEQDFLQTFADLSKRDSNLIMTERDGTYMVKSPGVTSLRDYSCWGIMFHKYWSYANDIRLDKSNGERYYPIRLSDHYITPCGRKIVG